MPRASDGTVTLVTGNPVAGGTAVSSTVHNATVADLAAMIQDSLSRSGKGGMQVSFQFADGTVAAPGIAFTNENNTGVYRAASNDVRVSMAGTDIFRLFKSAGNYFADLFTAAFVKTLKLDYGAGTGALVTINKPSGRVTLNAATGASSSVSNNLVTPTSIVFTVLETVDATATSILPFAPGSGGFTVTLNAVPTGTVKIAFAVFN